MNYHNVREAVACGIDYIGKEYTDTYLPDVLKKVPSMGRKDNLISFILYPNSNHIVESHDDGEQL